MSKRAIFITLLLFFTNILLAQQKVACVGNSVTFGYKIDNPQERYPAVLQELLGEEYIVKNFGHSGATLLKKGHRPYNTLPEYKTALEFKPDIVIIHLGLNDTDPRNWPKFRDEFIRDYISLIDTFKSINSKAEIKICRMTPIFTGHARFKSSTRDWFWQIQESIENISKIKDVELVDLHTPLYRRPDLFPDYLHPNGEGAKILAQIIYSAITKNFAGLKLSPIFSDNMVLQRNKPITFYGSANALSMVSVTFNKETKNTKVAKNGKWKIIFPPISAGGPYTALIKNENQNISIKNILIGEVWICSGQSNMVFKVRQSSTAKSDINNATNNQIRLYNMQPIAYTNDIVWDDETLKKVNKLEYFADTQWETCSPESIKDFSAVAYHFGKTIQEAENVPVGLIFNAIGGSPAEAWIDRKTLEHNGRLVDMFSNWTENDYIYLWCRQRGIKNAKLQNNSLQRHPYQPAYLFESGIDFLTDFPIKGIIWYQGESNEHNVKLYQEIFPNVITSWRNSFHADLPFYYVQLSSMAVGRETWGHFRDMQRKILNQLPNIGMAVSSDFGDSTDVHPRNKKPIGERLARWALYKDYHHKDIIPSGPLYKDVKFKNGYAYISFLYDLGLRSSDGEALRTFELAEYPGLYYPAKAEIIGNSIKVSSDKVKNPKYVRYGYQPYSLGNLVNKENLPASTFSNE